MRVKLMQGNCLERLKEIKNNSIDCIITDPPYGIGYKNWDRIQNLNKIIFQYNRILKKDSSIFSFCGWSNVCKIIDHYKKYFTLNDWIIYDRIKGRGCKKRLVSTREDILWFINGNEWVFNKEIAYSKIEKKTKGMGSKNNKPTRALSNIWTDISPIVPWSKERIKHPTQKPIELMERIINVFTSKNDIILDPFMGSGSTGVAALRLNRKFIGIELNKDYFRIAKKRIRDE